MVDRALKAGVGDASGAKRVNTNVNFEDLENDANALGDTDAGRILNRMLTFVRKLEMKVDERLEISEFNRKMEELRSTIESNMGSMDNLSIGGPSSNAQSAATGLSDRERKKWNDACKKLGELEKQVYTITSDLKTYEDAKVITNITSILK